MDGSRMQAAAELQTTPEENGEERPSSVDLSSEQKVVKQQSQTKDSTPPKATKHKPSVNLYLTKNSGQYFTSRQATMVPFTCEECGEDFESISSLVVHFRGHFNGSLFECNVCHIPFSSRSTLDRHMAMHEADDSSLRTSKTRRQCDLNVNGAIDLSSGEKPEERLNPMDTKEELFRCILCGKSFVQEAELDEHSSHHSNQKLFTCECGRGYQHQHLLDNHIKLHHVELWTCSDCGKTFDSQKRLLVHFESHSGHEVDKPHKCDECGKAFAARSKLIRHVRVHTGERPFRCDVCGRGFNDRSNLFIHSRVHTGEKPYVCQRCGKRFTGKNDLNRHLMIHSGEKPHTCNQCGKGFREKSKLNRHINTHSILVKPIEKPHTCVTCGKSFREKSKLRRHSKIHDRNSHV